jgi:hypothetical protein
MTFARGSFGNRYKNQEKVRATVAVGLGSEVSAPARLGLMASLNPWPEGGGEA